MELAQWPYQFYSMENPMTEQSLKQYRSGATFSRRALIQASLAGGAGLTLALAGCAPTQSSGSSKTLRLLMPSSYDLGKVNKLTKAPPVTATDTNGAALYKLLHSWKQKHPDVTLDIEVVPWESITQRVLLMAKSGKPADLIMVNDLNIPKLSRGGLLTPLDSFPGEWSGYNQKILRGGICSNAGKIYALPFTTDCRHEIYWKADFEKAGISKTPSTWDEYTSNLDALKGAGFEDPYSFWAGNSVHTPTMTLFSQIWMLGGDVVNDHGGATLTTPEVKEAFKYYNMLMNEKKVSSRDLISISKDDPYLAQFTGKKTSALKTGAWAWANIAQAKLTDQVGYFRTPKPTASDKDVTLSGFWAFELPKQKSPNEKTQELAFDLAMHFTNAAGQASYIGDVDGALPTRAAVFDSPQAKAKDTVWQFQAKYAVEAGRSMPAAGNADLLFAQTQTAFQTYLTGAASLDDALATAQKTYNAQAS